MAKNNIEVELEDEIQPVNVTEEVHQAVTKQERREEKAKGQVLISCLTNEKVTVKFVPKEGGLVTDPKHILYGGMGLNSHRKIVVPILSSGIYKNVLTNEEKAYLEYIMGLPDNAMSVYKRDENFWENRGVICGKEPFTLDLSNPEDYIKYKILLANDEIVCPNPELLKSKKRATYQFVLIKEGEEANEAWDRLKATQQAFKLLESIGDDRKKLAYVIEAVTGRQVSKAVSTEELGAMVEKTIMDNTKKFINTIQEPYFNTKLFINECIEAGLIRRRNNWYYLTETNQPLCGDKQEPTLNSACEYLNAPKNQELLFTLQAKLKK